MISLVAVLLTLSAGMYSQPQVPAVRMPVTGVELRYDRPIGQISHYRASLDVSGTEVSLGEKLPVQWKAEVGLSEEVVAKGKDGSLWLRVTARPVDVSNANSAFAGGMAGEWPELRVHLSPRGEVLETVRPEVKGDPRVRERSFAALMTQLAPVILPEAPVEPGDEWQWEANGARQNNRLLSIQAGGGQQLARISSIGTFPLALDDTIGELGLETHLTGEATQTSEVELLVSSGLVRRQRGRARILTRSRTSLLLPEGSQTFTMEGDLTVSFDVRLQSVDPRPVEAR